ncbi:MAG: hypothetical protein JNK79_19560 [Chitinophagaceae bacterium]|nr:hypothetical protein [Chitinophagaceae bacterium]
MKNLYLLVALSAVICSCSSTNRMSLSVLNPAPVTIPAHVKNVSIINRSLPLKENRVFDAADKILSFEGAELDKEGSKAGVNGLVTELSRNERFTSVNVVNQTQFGNKVPSMFPTPLTWDEVEKLCAENNSDALFSLEMFDTDSKISYSAQPVKVNTPFGNVPAIEQEANMLTTVKTGWRIYDLRSKFVLDEFAVARHLNFKARGINPVIAANALIGRKEAVKEVGARTGEGYALRVLPYWLRVSRDYYVRGTNNFGIAKRKAQTGNWDEAGKLWLQETNNGKRKVAGRACYNMAIISEINGNLDEAVRWAQKSYEDYNCRLALYYVRVLEQRKIDNSILSEQQSNEVAGANP